MLMIRKQHNIRIKKTGVSSYDWTANCM
jgi:hypothetical protein